MIDKVCPTCESSFKAKRNSTIFCSKSCAQRNQNTKNKIIESQKAASIEKYGVDHPMKNSNVVSNFKKSMIEKYGVEHALQSKSFVEKSFKSKLEKYGVGNYNNVKQARETCLRKYGVPNYSLTDEYVEKTKITCLKKYGVDHPSKSKVYKISHSENMFTKFMSNERFVNFVPKFTLDEYRGVTPRFNRRYPFECKRCGLETLCDISNGKPPRCSKCDTTPLSYFEKEVYEFIRGCVKKETSVIQTDRTTLYPKEIDILIPDLKLGIECDGLYWHSEILGKKNKVYHSSKTMGAMVKEIRLVHVFENEWKFKGNIVRSILKNILGLVDFRLFARNCVIVVPTRDEYKKFVVDNHIQGMDNPSVIYGLKYGDEIVSVMSFCKSRFDRKYQYELSRFCNVLNTSVIGAASRLFKHFIDTHKPTSVVSYSDRRYFSGEIYMKMGMLFVGNSPPNYYYIVDGYQNVKNRMSFQKHKLKRILPIFDNNISEWENMKLNGFDRIWDCGNSKWVYTK
jgi:hypothetical protein